MVHDTSKSKTANEHLQDIQRDLPSENDVELTISERQRDALMRACLYIQDDNPEAKRMVPDLWKQHAVLHVTPEMRALITDCIDKTAPEEKSEEEIEREQTHLEHRWGEPINDDLDENTSGGLIEIRYQHPKWIFRIAVRGSPAEMPNYDINHTPISDQLKLMERCFERAKVLAEQGETGEEIRHTMDGIICFGIEE